MKEIIEDIKWEISWYYRNYIRVPFMEVKWFVQRGRRGWADCDTWCMADYLSGIIPEMIDYDNENSIGYPSKFQTEEEWIKVKNDIAAGFRCYKLFNEGDDWYDENKTQEQNQKNWVKFYKETQRSVEKSSKLLGKHFDNLWD